MEDDVGKPDNRKQHRIDPEWPDVEHPVSELAADRQGALSPFGELTFPLDSVPYVHPETEINKSA
ncbi:hypothetical protein [Saccharomonospora xinjiangensis]|uniref:hypothetical protein n=1 Tax=Saccharomonospora xinjiangensis TaxID=75294 RepID=UPI000A07899B|nr:hypothetical protein [Saccharomonospora xinjiangensis]